MASVSAWEAGFRVDSNADADSRGSDNHPCSFVKLLLSRLRHDVPDISPSNGKASPVGSSNAGGISVGVN